MTPIDEYYNRLEEPMQGLMLAIKTSILSIDQRLNLQWKYQMPFFCVYNKMFCYSRVDKKTGELYISFADGYRLENPLLQSDGRKRFKLLYINPNEDLPIDDIRAIVNSALSYYK